MTLCSGRSRTPLNSIRSRGTLLLSMWNLGVEVDGWRDEIHVVLEVLRNVISIATDVRCPCSVFVAEEFRFEQVFGLFDRGVELQPAH